MATQVTVSSKFQIVLPEEVRTPLKIRPGQKLAVLRMHGTISLIPVRPLREMIGSMPSHDWHPNELRDKQDRAL